MFVEHNSSDPQHLLRGSLLEHGISVAFFVPSGRKQSPAKVGRTARAKAAITIAIRGGIEMTLKNRRKKLRQTCIYQISLVIMIRGPSRKKHSCFPQFDTSRVMQILGWPVGGE